MIKKLILVGCTTQNNKLVNGQSMMFQLVVDQLRERNINTIIVDFGNSVDPNSSIKRISGKISLIKFIDNFILIFRFLFVLFSNLGTPIYINTSQSKFGFIRDYIFINIGVFFGSKVTAHQFGSNYNKFFYSQSDSFKKKIINTLNKTDKIIVEGDYTKEQFSFLKDHEEKVVSIPNGLPEKICKEQIHAKNIDIDRPVKMLYLSNLIESKGYWDVLEAVNILVNKNHRNVEAIFSGQFLGDVDDKMFTSSGQAKTEFFSYIKKHDLAARITYYEGLFGQSKAEAFTNSHFFLLPSYYVNEGQPVSILEALAYGCVPIVTEYRLIPDMVNKENGFFVNPRSPEEIAAVVNKMIEDPSTYHLHSQAGINSYLDHFTAEKFMDKVLKLF